jgi:hypothetical protein
MENREVRVNPEILASIENLCRLKENPTPADASAQLERAEAILAAWRAGLPAPLPGTKIHTLKCDG